MLKTPGQTATSVAGARASLLTWKSHSARIPHVCLDQRDTGLNEPSSQQQRLTEYVAAVAISKFRILAGRSTCSPSVPNRGGGRLGCAECRTVWQSAHRLRREPVVKTVQQASAFL